MFIPFLYELRRRGVPVGLQEAVALAEALAKGLHDSSLDGFYHVARSLLVHGEAHLDAFDEAFLAYFRGVRTGSAKLHDDLIEWLRDAAARRDRLTPEELALLQSMDPETILREFEERLRQQTERHDGGSYWIGTGGTSPFGNSGAAPTGIRIGGGGGRTAFKVADARLYRPYRSDLTFDVRQMAVALRKLRAFAREGAPDELDLEGTIDATAKNAGELEVVTRPPRRPNTRVVLMMDVGGSMEPYAHLVSRLFSAASKATHFKELRSYYFHNCIYGRLYRTERLEEPISVQDVIASCGRHHELILVGDALMAPYELLGGGFTYVQDEDRNLPGIAWLQRLAAHFERHVWLNPEPPRFWPGTTIEKIGDVFSMCPLTLEGLGEAVGHLVKGRTGRKNRR